jgi:hypothetical protein
VLFGSVQRSAEDGTVRNNETSIWRNEATLQQNWVIYADRWGVHLKSIKEKVWTNYQHWEQWLNSGASLPLWINQSYLSYSH